MKSMYNFLQTMIKIVEMTESKEMDIKSLD